MFGACFEAVQKSMLASSRKCSESVESWGSCNGSNRNLENEMGMDLKIQHLWLLLCLEMVCIHQRHWWGRVQEGLCCCKIQVELYEWSTRDRVWDWRRVLSKFSLSLYSVIWYSGNLHEFFIDTCILVCSWITYGDGQEERWGQPLGLAPTPPFSLTFSTAFRFGMVSTALRAVCCCSAAVLGLLLAQLIWPRRCPRSCREPSMVCKDVPSPCWAVSPSLLSEDAALSLCVHPQLDKVVMGSLLPPNPAVIHSRTFQRLGVFSLKCFQ